MKISRILESNPDYDNKEMSLDEKIKYLHRKLQALQQEMDASRWRINKMKKTGLIVTFNEIPKGELKNYELVNVPANVLAPVAIYVKGSDQKTLKYIYALKEKIGQLAQFMEKTQRQCSAAEGQVTKAENKLKKDPETAKTKSDWAFHYANEVLHGPFPEGEDAIAKDFNTSFMYANLILKARFPKGEPIIMTNPYTALAYADLVIHGPWPEAEDSIIKQAGPAYEYAVSVLKGPFPKGEDIISTDPLYSIPYARHILKARFPKAEPDIKKRGGVELHSYEKFFGVKL